MSIMIIVELEEAQPWKRSEEGELSGKNRMDVSCKTFVYLLTFHNSEF